MKLQTLVIKNFRGINDLVVPFDGKCTVLYGENGIGKSSILNAIDILFARLITRITDYRPSLKLSKDDIAFGKEMAFIRANFCFDGDCYIDYSRSIYRKAEKRIHSAGSLNQFADLFSKLYLSESASKECMPIFANYGVNRAVLDIPLRISKKHSFERQAAFENAIQSRIDFRVFFEWFRNQEDLENEIKVESQNMRYQDRSLTAVRTAAVSILEGFHDLRVSRNPLRMTVIKNEQTLRIEQLSDGEKCTIALFGDLARRLSIANPGIENPLRGGGIVLIDEIDLHMHPAWQRKIMRTLHNVFPNIQFIVTTHSPQILGDLDESFNILHIYRNLEDNSVCYSSIKPGFYDSNLVLEDFMGVASVNSKVLELHDRISQELYKNELDAVKFDIAILDKITNGSDPFITEATILLKRKEP